MKPETAKRLHDASAAATEFQRYVSVHHRITHGYDSVDYGVLWGVAHDRLPTLIDDLGNLLRDAPPPEPET